MHRFLVLFAFLCLFFFIKPALAANVNYVPFTEDFSNPERGFMGQTDVWPDQTGSFSGIDKANVNDSLIWIYFRLDNYRSKPLDTAGLNRIRAAFDEARSKKMKVVARFIYNFGPGWTDVKSQMTPDAPIDLVLQHISQLAPVFQEEADTIAAIQAGFAGHYGEWHSSYYDLNSPQNGKRIIEALLAALPPGLMLQMRYPTDKKTMYGSPIADSEAFGRIPKSRIGHHNDCFLANEDDEGTYRTYPLQTPTTSEIQAWKDYVAQDGLYTPVGGESCTLNPPRSSCQSALTEMSQLRWSFMNNEYHPDVLNDWISGGCMTDVRKKLGYRFLLISGDIPTTAASGGIMPISIVIKNDGFASPYNRRPAYIVFDNVSGRYEIPLLGLDLRLLRGSVEALLTINLALPSSIPSGSYRMSLWLPDPSDRLKSDPAFSIRLANASMWEQSTGMNVLAPSIIISSTSCIKKNTGDSDCDGVVNISDFEIWRKEYFQTISSKTADFDTSGKIDLADFEIWRKGYFGLT